jgi:plastocyanin
MNTILSRAIFGVGIILALAAFISIYVTSIAQQEQNIQGTTAPNIVAQPSGANTSTATVTNQSSSAASSAVSSIAIAEGSAAQQVKVYYQPNPAEIAGDSKVTWTNNDIAPHTATASDSSFDTGVIPVGSSGSAIVKGQGNISYRCTIHPWMTGLIRITGSSQT